MSKFRYYIFDGFNDRVMGTNDEQVARETANDDTMYVIDSELGILMYHIDVEIEQYGNDDEDREDDEDIFGV